MNIIFQMHPGADTNIWKGGAQLRSKHHLGKGELSYVRSTTWEHFEILCGK